MRLFPMGRSGTNGQTDVSEHIQLTTGPENTGPYQSVACVNVLSALCNNVGFNGV